MILLFGGSVVNVADDKAEGSITLNAPSGSFTLFMAGTRQGDSFWPTDDFKEYKELLEDIESEEAAAELAEYVNKNQLTGITKDADTDGEVRFTGLQDGLYLVMQMKTPDGYYPILPFLVTIPYEENGVWNNHVDADPKMEKIPVSSIDKNDSIETKDTPQPGKTSVSVLPQTGQLKWPVPILAIAGILLFSYGWHLYQKK